MKTIVKKYGGATLADPEKIKCIAVNLKECHLKGERLIVIVSAMGQTTNELIQLAHKVSLKPKRREMDMLLSTGERISMSLLSMALNDLDQSAISFTGSQAGVLTDDSHLNAFITEVNSPRVKVALDSNQIVIIAGFQGVSPKTKEVTTIGRGGSDTTAVAMAASLNADHCEILKDVSGVYSADPRVCPVAHTIHKLSYEQMLEMTYWGAKVLHYRSVELALLRKVKIYIGPAHNNQEGTWITSKDEKMFESIHIISVNSHADLIKVTIKDKSATKALGDLRQIFLNNEISLPQLLAMETDHLNQPNIYLTGPPEVLSAIRRTEISLLEGDSNLCTITATCSGASTPEIAEQICRQLESDNIVPIRIWMSGMSCTVLLKQDQRIKAITHVHTLVNIPVVRS